MSLDLISFQDYALGLLSGFLLSPFLRCYSGNMPGLLVSRTGPGIMPNTLTARNQIQLPNANWLMPLGKEFRFSSPFLPLLYWILSISYNSCPTSMLSLGCSATCQCIWYCPSALFLQPGADDFQAYSCPAFLSLWSWGSWTHLLCSSLAFLGLFYRFFEKKAARYEQEGCFNFV